MTHQPLWVILCRLPEKRRTEIEEIVEEMKEGDRKERGTGMIELGLNYMSTLVGHFVSSQRKGGEIEEIVEEMKERDRGERQMNESEETEEIETFPLYPYLLQG